MREGHDVLVVGAGVAGLAAAHGLARDGLSVSVLEREHEPGGRARTTSWAGCPVERGAVYLTSRYRTLLRLARDVGVDGRLVPLPNAFATELKRGGRWHRVDYQRPWTVPASGALSVAERASLAGIQAATLRALPRMRFGDLASAASLDGRAIPTVRAAHERLVTPVIEVFCGYRPADVTLPLVALSTWFAGRAQTFAGGMGTLTGALAERLPVEYGVAVAAVEQDGDRVRVRTEDGDEHHARAVVMATPADVTAGLWAAAPEYVRSVEYRGMALLYLRTRTAIRPRYGRRRDLYMKLVPTPELHGRALQALCFLDHMAPDGGLLLANASAAARESLGDDELARRLREEAEELCPELRGAVTDELLLRKPRVVASFGHGGARRAAEFRDSAPTGPIAVAGDYTHGVWMESAAQSGALAAERVSAYLAGAPVMSGEM